ncbi:MAG: hypothetical protein H0U78_01415 [Rickettsiaceae bacterium]|jgi:hypothetical protein|nr:hypothetical protein [Rickettsiaceae bacterium]
MEQEKQRQIKNLVVKAFSKIGDGLGDLLYDEEVTLVSLQRNTNIEIDHDFLTEELDSILAESYQRLLIKITSCLNAQC